MRQHITFNLLLSPTKLPTLSFFKEVVFWGWPKKREECSQSGAPWSLEFQRRANDWGWLRTKRRLHRDISNSQTRSLEHHTPTPSRTGEMPFASTFIWPAITKEIINQVNQWSLPEIPGKKAEKSQYYKQNRRKGSTYRRTLSQLRSDTTAVSAPQRQRIEAPAYQGPRASRLDHKSRREKLGP